MLRTPLKPKKIRCQTRNPPKLVSVSSHSGSLMASPIILSITIGLLMCWINIINKRQLFNRFPNCLRNYIVSVWHVQVNWSSESLKTLRLTKSMMGNMQICGASDQIEECQPLARVNTCWAFASPDAPRLVFFTKFQGTCHSAVYNSVL